ncbi:hypothetical protein LR002_03160 [Candidatus Gracilibacteria bacterium]|nr:hypothetical protein [Candidatus Gracilibacteria bacterium]
MKIFYQGIKGSYSSIPVYEMAKKYGILEENIFGCDENFTEIWKKIDAEKDAIGVLPIENSYAGMIHENLFNFLHFDFKIIGEVSVQVNHCLLSKEKNISDVKKVFSHPQALSQCFEFCEKNGISQEKFVDTALSAKMLAESDEKGIGAITSRNAGEIFGLNILAEGIQDQDGNTTRMFIVAKKSSDFVLKNDDLKGKISILFELRNHPAALYKCLGAFATNDLNLTKIESMPNLKNPFNYLFCIDFEGKMGGEKVKNMFKELEFFAEQIKVLGEY